MRVRLSGITKKKTTEVGAPVVLRSECRIHTRRRWTGAATEGQEARRCTCLIPRIRAPLKKILSTATRLRKRASTGARRTSARRSPEQNAKPATFYKGGRSGAPRKRAGVGVPATPRFVANSGPGHENQIRQACVGAASPNPGMRSGNNSEQKNAPPQLTGQK